MFTSLKIALAKFIAVPLLAILSLSGHAINQPTTIIQQIQAPQNHQEQMLGAFNPTAAGTYYLEGGINTSVTSFYLSSFVEPISNIPYTMTYLQSSIEYGVIDPLTPNRSELISFTGITQNSDGSATLTGVTRGLSRSYPFTASTTLALTHAAQAQFILSATPQVFGQYAAKQNNEVITGEWSGPTPLSNADFATKNYVDTLVNGGTVSNAQVVVAGTAGETVSAGQVLYFQQSAARWFKAATTISEASSTILGIAQGSGTAGNPVTGGVLTSGVDTNQSGLTAGSNYFLSSTSGTLSISTSTRIIGRAQTTTRLYFNTSMLVDGIFQASSTFTGINTFTGTTTLASTTNIGSFQAFNIGKNYQAFTTPGAQTFTRPFGVTSVLVRMIGGGGAGIFPNGAAGGGGGGAGGYAEARVDLTGTTSVSVFVGSGGACSVSPGTAGTSSLFGPAGSFITAAGGGGAAASSFGSGGTATLNSSSTGYVVTGGAGTPGTSQASNGTQGQGASSYFGSAPNGFGAGSNCYTNTSATKGSDGAIIVSW